VRKFPESIYFSGIGGSGVSALACFMASRGHRVTGSDRAFEVPGSSHPALGLLRANGITIVAQDARALDPSFGLMVISTAVEPDRPEMQKARALGIPVKTRPEFLADIVNSFRSIAVAGTSGKSTTSGMLAHAMSLLGMEPNFLGGGRVKGLASDGSDTNYLSGASDVLVFEADESDGSIVSYRPEHTVLLNLSLDHNPVEKTSVMFDKLLDHTSGMKVLNADDPAVHRWISKGTVTFSIDEDAAFKAEDVELQPFDSTFRLSGTRFRLQTPGRHHVIDALAAITLLAETGQRLGNISEALSSFRGIGRRFDIHLNTEDALVIDDYAHNPHKISFLMEAIGKASPGPVCYVFQPHGFGPTRLMKDGYIEAFTRGLRAADRLLVLPIFYAGGTTSKDISSGDLVEGVRKNGRNADTAGGWDDVMRFTDEYSSFVVLGARDERLSELAALIASRLRG
jgi:UDP-N-acetylmuramate--alanine ligase